LSSTGQERAQPETGIRPMQYRVLAGTAVTVSAPHSSEELYLRVQELELKLKDREQQFARQLEKARLEAVEQGKQSILGEQAGRHRQGAAQLETAVEGFRAQIENYFARVEHEVVQLALAVAERVLHREAQLDPLLLSGAVRVALGQLAESTEVRLRVPADQKEMWTETVRLMPGMPLRPQVVPDPEMQLCEAVLETNLGTVNLGVHAQLKEIERGFFDLLDVRKDRTEMAVETDGNAKQG